MPFQLILIIAALALSVGGYFGYDFYKTKQEEKKAIERRAKRKAKKTAEAKRLKLLEEAPVPRNPTVPNDVIIPAPSNETRKSKLKTPETAETDDDLNGGWFDAAEEPSAPSHPAHLPDNDIPFVPPSFDNIFKDETKDEVSQFVIHPELIPAMDVPIHAPLDTEISTESQNQGEEKTEQPLEFNLFNKSNAPTDIETQAQTTDINLHHEDVSHAHEENLTNEHAKIEPASVAVDGSIGGQETINEQTNIPTNQEISDNFVEIGIDELDSIVDELELSSTVEPEHTHVDLPTEEPAPLIKNEDQPHSDTQEATPGYNSDIDEHNNAPLDGGLTPIQSPIHEHDQDNEELSIAFHVHDNTLAETSETPPEDIKSESAHVHEIEKAEPTDKYDEPTHATQNLQHEEKGLSQSPQAQESKQVDFQEDLKIDTVSRETPYVPPSTINISDEFDFNAPFDDSSLESLLAPISSPFNDARTSKRPARILYVDDSRIFRLKMETMLKDSGCRVLLASDGDEAHRILIEDGEMVDMIFSDVEMPIMDGFKLFKSLQSDDRTKNVPFVIITGSYENVVIANDSGCSEALLKPFKEHDIEKLLRRHLPAFF